MARAVRFLCPVHWLLLCLWLAGSAAAAEPARLESQVKAAYLIKFAGFADWPPSAFARADSPLVIGVAGNDELASQLERMAAGRNIGGHALVIRRLRRGDSPLGLHMLYVGGAERALAGDLFAAVRGLPLLTVSDAVDMPSGMIRFLVVDERLRFEVALREVASAGLKISARMLAAAWRVTGAS